MTDSLAQTTSDNILKTNSHALETGSLIGLELIN